jgi:hypothetical protein
MKVQSYACDECGTQKRQTNHWWLLWVGVCRSGPPDAFYLIPWDEKKAATDDHEHLCGQECVGRALAKWLGQASGNVVAPKQSGTELFGAVMAPEEGESD